MGKYSAAEIYQAKVAIMKEMGYTAEQRLRSAYWNTSHPGHEMAVEEMLECHRVAAGDDGDNVINILGEGTFTIPSTATDSAIIGSDAQPNSGVRTASDVEVAYDTPLKR